MRLETIGMNNVRGLVVEIDGDHVKIDASRVSRGGGTISTVDLDRYKAFLGGELPEIGDSLADWYKTMLDAAVAKGSAPLAGMASKSTEDTIAVNIPVVYFAGVRNKNLAKLSKQETDELVSFLCSAVAEAL
jgi:hypothetical protein